MDSSISVPEISISGTLRDILHHLPPVSPGVIQIWLFQSHQMCKKGVRGEVVWLFILNHPVLASTRMNNK
jgi:hypothetical protein